MSGLVWILICLFAHFFNWPSLTANNPHTHLSEVPGARRGSTGLWEYNFVGIKGCISGGEGRDWKDTISVAQLCLTCIGSSRWSLHLCIIYIIEKATRNLFALIRNASLLFSPFQGRMFAVLFSFLYPEGEIIFSTLGLSKSVTSFQITHEPEWNYLRTPLKY